MSLIPRFAFLDWGKIIQNYNKFCTKCEKSCALGEVHSMHISFLAMYAPPQKNPLSLQRQKTKSGPNPALPQREGDGKSLTWVACFETH